MFLGTPGLHFAGTIGGLGSYYHDGMGTPFYRGSLSSHDLMPEVRHLSVVVSNPNHIHINTWTSIHQDSFAPCN